jgi:hypothetical protein
MTTADELFESIAHGRMERVKEILDLEPALLSVRDTLGDTPLHVAVWNARVDIAAFLLERKADLNAKDGDGRTPLAGLVDTIEACDHEGGATPASREFLEMKELLERFGAVGRPDDRET